MKIKTLKLYQEQAMANGLAQFHYARGEYAKLPAEAGPEQRRALAAHEGCLLLEAPTGSGKTLMAARLLEEFSRWENVVWFWFAPFKGVTGQTMAFLKEQCGLLRVRDLAQDRQLAGTAHGDVFVTTWQTVAVKNVDKRNARKDSEQAPGTDTLVSELRKAGFRIGVVVDEAHHSFHGQTQAAVFYKDVLAPDYTVLITATPDDSDIKKWQKQSQVEKVHRIAISRADAVNANLVKAGAKCITFIPEPHSEGLVDMELTCLRCATAMQHDLRAKLKTAGISLAPLMLVQVDSKKKDSVARAKEKLLQCGWKEEQIATHTAEEPDAGLLALANDEKREVLIFKMAVALGFDAPRAWTLVSMRPSKDEDFGVQLLGRILRVHRRLQGRQVPEELQHGYVLLANPDAQSGLEAAGQRINALKTEMDKVAPTAGVVCIAGVSGVQVMEPGGQTTLFPFIAPGKPEPPPEPKPAGDGVKPTKPEGGQQDLFGGETQTAPGETAAADGTTTKPSPGLVAALTGTTGPATAGAKSWPLKAGVPRRFKSVMLPAAIENLEEECSQYFMVDAEAILSGLVSKVQVQKRTVEVFTGELALDFEQADLSRAEVARRAQEFLLENENFDAKVLKQFLLARLTQHLSTEGIGNLSAPEETKHILNAILLHRPDILREAQRKAIGFHATLEETGDLPEALHCDGPVTQSKRNVYGIYPPGLNNWELQFAEYLDGAPAGVVRWWHRNEVKRPWSVSLVLPEGKRFFPDFVISIEGRKKDQGVLLADPKGMWEASEQHSKVTAEHPSYGKALIITKAGNFGWKPIVWNQKTQKPDIGGDWGWDQAAVW